MTGVLVLLAIALIICLCFMGITVYMYFQLEKDFEKQKTAIAHFSAGFEQFSDDIAIQIHHMEDLSKLSEQALNDAKKIGTDASNQVTFAMTTIQEVRKMLRPTPTANQVVYEDGKPKEIRSTATMEDFKFEEKEEDPEEPRS